MTATQIETETQSREEGRILRGFANFQCYKPNNQRGGAASQIQLKITLINEYGKRRGELFWEGAPQLGDLDKDGNATFDWQNKIIMKLGLPDIGEILAVLNDRKPCAGSEKGLFHQNARGNAILYFQKFKTEHAAGYNVRLSTKRDTEAKQVKHSLTIGEGEILRVLLERAVAQFHGW